MSQTSVFIKPTINQQPSNLIYQGMSEQLAKDAIAGNVIYTFGSFRLGVHSPGADIDTLCIGPRNIRREDDFFNVLGDILREHPEVTELAVCIVFSSVTVLSLFT